MASVDERIVSISFDNAKFEANIAKTIASLHKLNEALKLVGAVNGLKSIETASNNVKMTTAQTSAANLKKSADFTANAKSLRDIEAASNQVKLSGVKSAADETSSRFSRMADTARNALGSVKNTLTPSRGVPEIPQLRNSGGQFAAIEKESHQVKLQGIQNGIAQAQKGFTVLKGAAAVAFGGIAASAAAAGAKTARSLVSPIKGGFSEYEDNINSVQTIMANTEGQKGSGLKNVNKALDELNAYADQTKYSFKEMTKNVGTFTAAGVNIGDALPSIKGVANLAAISGSSSQQASTAMYQLSQALSSGKVGLQDWNSVVNAGMGGKLFQKAIVKQALAMGTLKGKVEGLDDPMKKLKINGKSFREAIKSKPGEESFFSSDVLAGTLKGFSGDMKEADLIAQGYTKTQAAAVMKQAKLGLEAATSVKTFTNLVETTKEAVGSGWATTFKLVLGDFGQAKKLFSGVSKVVSGAVGKMADDRNNLLKGWAKLGGRSDMFEGLKQSFAALKFAWRAVTAGFREIFPKATSKDLAEASERFKDFATSLRASIQNRMPVIQKLVAGFFAAFSIGFQIIKRIIGVFVDLGGAAGGAAGGGIKDIALAISGFLIAIDKALKRGTGFRDIIATFPAILKAPLNLLADLAGAIKKFFSGGRGSGKQIGGEFDIIQQKMQPLKNLMEKIGNLWQAFKDKVTAATTAIRPGIDKIKVAFSNFGASFVKAFNNVDYSAILLGIQTALLGGIVVMFKKFFSGGLGEALGIKGTFGELGKVFGGLTGYLKTMQLEVKSNIILKIAIALAILTLSIVALSGIDAVALDKAMSALTLAFVQLAVAMKVMTNIAVSSGKGAALMPVLAAGLILIAIAMRILVSSVTALSKLSYEELRKGLGAVTILFAAMAAAAIPLGAAGGKIAAAGLGMLLIAVAMRVLSKAIITLSKLSWQELGKGLAAIAASLLVVLVVVTLIPIKLPIIAYGLIAFAGAMIILAKAIMQFGNMKWSEIARGLTAMAGALVIIAAAVLLLPKSLALQAAGMLIMAVAVRSLANSIVIMSKLSPEQVFTSLYGLGGALTILAAGLYAMNSGLKGAAALLIATTALKAFVPVILTLGTMPIAQLLQGLGAIGIGFGILTRSVLLMAPAIPVLLSLSVAVVLMGIGIGAVATGVGKLVEAFALLLTAMSKLGGGGESLKALKEVFSAFFDFLGKLVTAIPRAIGDFVSGLGNMAVGLVSVIPKFVQAIVAILNAVLNIIILLAPKFIEGFGVILIGILNLIIVSAPKIGQAVLALLLSLLTVLETGVPRMIEVGFRLITALLQGLNSNIAAITIMASNIIINLLNALAVKIPAIVQAGANLVIRFLDGLAREAPRITASATNLVVKFSASVVANAPRLVSAAATIIVTFLNSIAKAVPRLVTAGVNLVLAFLRGVGKNADKLGRAAADLMGDFISAAANSILRFTDRLGRIILNFLNGIESAIRKYQTPITRAGGRIAKALIEGMIQGVLDLGGVLRRAVTKVFSLLPGWAKDVLGISSPSTVFAEIGGFVTMGFAQGITESSSTVRGAAETLGNNAVTSLQRSVRGISDALSTNIDMDPTITPVLDISQVQSEAKKLGSLTNVTPITAAVSYGQASAISSETEALQSEASAAAAVIPQPSTEIKFEQNNYSPESLSAAEVYRQTSNQLGQAKVQLGIG